MGLEKNNDMEKRELAMQFLLNIGAVKLDEEGTGYYDTGKYASIEEINSGMNIEDKSLFEYIQRLLNEAKCNE